MAKKMAAVLYHYPCPDGAFAALAAHLFFSATSTSVRFFPNTVYAPLRPDQLPLHEIRDLYLLDFIGPPGYLPLIAAQVERVVVLDHHKTSFEVFQSEGANCVNVSTCPVFGENLCGVLDIQRSGATIAYDYFKEQLLHLAAASENDDTKNCTGCSSSSVLSEALHQFQKAKTKFQYIEDGDLWNWALPNSKAFSSGLKDSNIEFDVNRNPALFHQLLSLDLDVVINQGMTTLSEKQKLINEVLEQSFEIELGGGSFGRCLAVHADHISHLRSELGGQLARKSYDSKLRGIGAVVYKVPELADDCLLKISLRSGEGEDTTTISQKFGGGGHKCASSFMLNSTEFEKWKLKQS
ncbi:uncharacterized protein LOC124937765 [Impatiens glandulifera]|uniref:uncharacterized protein LOC124937765 n=1 Tax=Impatiens glandulifera TaxID=253017 RepID=UPI001FB0CB04|nr:uncharacterized protein LOC124937765 [Impatiens glandulifera]